MAGAHAPPVPPGDKVEVAPPTALTPVSRPMQPRNSDARAVGITSTPSRGSAALGRRARVGLCPSLNPEESPFLKQWDLMSAALLVLVAFLTPLEAGFLGCPPTPRWVVNQFINAFFVCDLCLQFFLPYQAIVGKTFVTVHMPWAIVKNYLRTWFFLDFVSVFPYEFIAPCGQQSQGGLNLGFLRAVRMMRLLKLLKLLRGFRMFARWQLEFGISKRKTTLYVIICFVIVAAHWIACVLGLLSKIQAGSSEACTSAADSEARDCIVTWLTNAGGWYDVIDGDHPYAELNNYLIGLHASMSILVHPHSYAPTSIIERVIFSLLMLLGGFIWTQVISRSTAMVTSLDRHNIAFASLMDDVNLISSDQNLPQDIRRRLRKYFLKMKDSSKEETWKTIMKKMSPKLRQDCAKEINKDWVKDIRFMNKLNRAVLAEITECLNIEGFSEGETFGEPHNLYILREGNSLLRKPNSQEFRVLIPGSVWGEDHLLLTCGELLSDNTAKAMNYVSVQSLNKVDFDAVLQLYPSDQANIRKVTVKYAMIQGVFRHVELQNPRSEVDQLDMDAHDLAHRARHRAKAKAYVMHRRAASQITAGGLGSASPRRSTLQQPLALEALSGKVDRLASQQDALMEQHERLLRLVERIATATGVSDEHGEDVEGNLRTRQPDNSHQRSSSPSFSAEREAAVEKEDDRRGENKSMVTSDYPRGQSDLSPFEVYI